MDEEKAEATILVGALTREEYLGEEPDDSDPFFPQPRRSIAKASSKNETPSGEDEGSSTP